MRWSSILILLGLNVMRMSKSGFPRVW